jgi:general stress protein YciG
MDPEKQREIASMGGRAAHEKGTAHEFTTDEARQAGRRGGRTVSRDRDYMAEIGRRGGLRSQGGRGHPEHETAARGRSAAAMKNGTKASQRTQTGRTRAQPGQRGTTATRRRPQTAKTRRGR